MKDKVPDLKDDLRPEYDFDFTKGKRGKYYERLLNEGLKIVILERPKGPAA